MPFFVGPHRSFVMARSKTPREIDGCVSKFERNESFFVTMFGTLSQFASFWVFGGRGGGSGVFIQSPFCWPASQLLNSDVKNSS